MHSTPRIGTIAFALASPLLAAGCPAPPAPADASDVVIPGDLVFVDVPVTPPRVPDYRRCGSNADCNRDANEAGGVEVCDLQFPGGMCRRALCTNNAQCGPLGVCVNARGCLPRCERQSDTCAQFGGLCLAFALPFEDNSACFPACDPAIPSAMGTSVDASAPRACAMGLQCDPHRGDCVSTPIASGALNGEPCRDDGDCRSGLCIPEVDRRMGLRPTGFLGGYCVSQAPLPRESVFAAARGMNLPRSTCPPDTVVLPSTDAPGSAARCLKACADDSVCRSGYRCDRGDPAAGYRNGGCVPIDCAAAGARCPEGSTCVRSDGDGGVLFTGSRCVRDGASSDAGVVRDASVDAGVSDGSATMDGGTPDGGTMDGALGD
jgi:hypothetical protein